MQAACLDGGYAQFSFETFEREPVQGGMWADGRAKGFQTGGQIVLRRCSRRILLEGNQLAFETAEEMFSHGVVAGIVPVGYVLRDAVRLQTFCGIPCASVSVLRRLRSFGPAAAMRHVQNHQRQLCGRCVLGPHRPQSFCYTGFLPLPDTGSPRWWGCR